MSVSIDLVALVSTALTKVRRRVSWETHGRRGRKTDPPWANRRRLLMGRDRLSGRAFATMWTSLIDSEPSGQILCAWIAKEQLRTLLALAGTGDRARISRALFAIYDWCARVEIDELTTLATTVET